MDEPIKLTNFSVKLKGSDVSIKFGNVEIDTGAYPYVISLREIKSPIHLIRWIKHLADKKWFTTRMASDLIAKVCQHHGWNPYG